MEGIMTGLTDKQEALARTIILAGIAAHGASLTGIVGVHFDGHTAIQRGFVGDHGMQFGKGPLAMTGVGFALLAGRFLAMLAFCALADVCQVLQATEGMWVLLHNALTHDMIGVLLQPSLSSANRSQATGRATSAFFLKTLSQTCVVVGLGNHGFARMEGGLSFHGARYRQITHAHIHTDDGGM